MLRLFLSRNDGLLQLDAKRIVLHHPKERFSMSGLCLGQGVGRVMVMRNPSKSTLALSKALLYYRDFESTSGIFALGLLCVGSIEE